MIKKLNKLKIKSLQWQILSRFFLILLLLLVILGVSQYITTKNYLSRSKAEILSLQFHKTDLKSLSSLITTESIKQEAPALIEKLSDININVSIIGEYGTVLSSSEGITFKSHYKEKEIETKLKELINKEDNSIILPPNLSKNDYIKLLDQYGSIEKVYKLYEDNDDNLQIIMWRKIGPIDSPTGLIQLSTPADEIGHILEKNIYIYISFSILILILGAFLGAMVFKQTLRPLSNMTSTVEEININQLNTRLPENNGQLEIDRLSSSFNNMLERIETSFEKEQSIKEKMQQFVSDASHELRTPLTSIHGFVEVLLRGAAKNEKQLDLALNSILLESERLTKLVNDLLLLTKLDQEMPIEMKSENLNNVLTEILPQLQILCGNRKIQLILTDNLNTLINKNQIKQVIFNLVENSVRHTNEDSGIITISTEIETTQADTFALLKISDNGSGISEKHLHKVFDRFFRGQCHRSRENGGYGLGLSIIKSIIDAHKGKIILDSEVSKGTTFTIYLKLIQ